MQKAEAQHSQQNQPAVRQQKGDALESPQSERIAQLEAMADESFQAGRLSQLAAIADASQMQVAQRRLASMIHNSPAMAAQRKEVDGIDNLVIAQRQEMPAKSNNTGLQDNLKSGIESLSGMSMDSVKVHYNSSQPAQLNALAYAQGTDIHVAPGQEQHLPHEAWHVVQQAQGRVKPTMQMKDGVPVNDDKGLEAEADAMGARALQMMHEKNGSTAPKPMQKVALNAFNNANGGLFQLKQIHETGSFGSLGLENTGHTFSVLDGTVQKPDATLYATTTDLDPVTTKEEALSQISAAAGTIGNSVKSVVKTESGVEGKKSGYTIANGDMNKSDVATIDPFTHGHVQEYGDSQYLCLMYQQTNGFDGYVNGIEEGVVESPGKYGVNFQQSMENGKKNRASLDGKYAPQDGHYSNQHDQTGGSGLLGLASGKRGKADAITKLAGEGARFQWVRQNISTMTDETEFVIGDTTHGNAVIKFSDLWCTWKDWFKGGYDITEDSMRATLLHKAERKEIKCAGVVRIYYK